MSVLATFGFLELKITMYMKLFQAIEGCLTNESNCINLVLLLLKQDLGNPKTQDPVKIKQKFCSQTYQLYLSY